MPIRAQKSMGMKLCVPESVSGGIFLSHKCSRKCRHCMCACSPRWKADWIPEKDLEGILTQLSERIQPSPLGPNTVGINYGLHFTGGEPFLNSDLLLKAIEIAREFGITSTFVETNSFWCTDDRATIEKLTRLKDSGLNGIVISVNLFILEQGPYERRARAIRISRRVFKENVMVYQEIFCNQFEQLNIQSTLLFEEYLRRIGHSGLSLVELLTMGRAAYKLGHLYKNIPPNSSSTSPAGEI